MHLQLLPEITQFWKESRWWAVWEDKYIKVIIGYLLEWISPERLEKCKRCAGVVSTPRSSIHPRGESRQPASQIVPTPMPHRPGWAGYRRTSVIHLQPVSQCQIRRWGRLCTSWLINGFDELLRCVVCALQSHYGLITMLEEKFLIHHCLLLRYSYM